MSADFVWAVCFSLPLFRLFSLEKTNWVDLLKWKAKQVARSLQFMWVSCSHDRKWVRKAVDAVQAADILQDNYRPVFTNDVPTDSSSSGFSSKFKWLAAVVRAITSQFVQMLDIHLVLLFFSAKLKQQYGMFPKSVGFSGFHLSIISGKAVWRSGGTVKKNLELKGRFHLSPLSWPARVSLPIEPFGSSSRFYIDWTGQSHWSV